MRSSNAEMPLSAFRLDRALPSLVRGPVDCSQGFQPLIASACFARRSGVHPDFRMAVLINSSFPFILTPNKMRQIAREARWRNVTG